MSNYGIQYDHPIPVERHIDAEPERLDLDQLIASLRPSWMAEGACVGTDPDLFFPPPGMHGDRPAKAICADCPVVDACLDYALTNHLDGIWGNTNGRERRRMRPAVKPGPRRAPIPHGTIQGYRAHTRHNDPACAPCKAAKRDHSRELSAQRRADQAAGIAETTAAIGPRRTVGVAS